MEPHVPACSPDERLVNIRQRLGPDSEEAVVLDENAVVLGILRRDDLAKPDATPAAAAMTPGVPTFRPNVAAKALADYFAEHDVPSALVTTPDGVLLGLIQLQHVGGFGEKQLAGQKRS